MGECNIVNGKNNTVGNGDYVIALGDNINADTVKNSDIVADTANVLRVNYATVRGNYKLSNILSDGKTQGNLPAAIQAHISPIDGTTENYIGGISNASNVHLEGAGNYTSPGPTASEIPSTLNVNHLEGMFNVSQGQLQHVEGYGNSVISPISHTEGKENKVNISSGTNFHTEGSNNTLAGNGSLLHIEGSANNINGGGSTISHIEGGSNTISCGGMNSTHIEGNSNKHLGGYGYYNHIEGFENSLEKSNSTSSHIEGNGNTYGGIDGSSDHIEGDHNTINDSTYVSHIEGFSNTIAPSSGNTGSGSTNSHIEGSYNVIDTLNNTVVSTHIGGFGNITNASCQTVIGRYNLKDNDKAFIIGNGVDSSDGVDYSVFDDEAKRSNAFTVDWNGNIVGGTYNGINIATLNTSVETLINEKGTASGLAILDENGKVLESELPYSAISIEDINAMFD